MSQRRRYLIAFTAAAPAIMAAAQVSHASRVLAKFPISVHWVTSPYHDTLPKVMVLADRSLHEAEYESEQVVNIAGAARVERSADITVADVVEHMSGITVINNQSGADVRTLIRGMPPKYNSILINGIRMPSPDDRSRNVSLNLFSADALQRIEVYKTLTADMNADAIGGAVNLVTRDAPVRSLLKVTLSLGYNTALLERPFTFFNGRVINKVSPFEEKGAMYSARSGDFPKENLSFGASRPFPAALANLLWSRRFMQKRIGITVSGNYAGIKSIYTERYLQQNGDPQLNNLPAFTDFLKRSYSSDVRRLGIFSQIDFSPDSSNRFNFQQSFVSQTEFEARESVDTSLAQGRSGPGTGRITILQRSREHMQSLYTAAITGSHRLDGRLLLRWNAAYSMARGSYPDWAELTASTARLRNPDNTVSQAPLFLAPLDRSWLRSREKEVSAFTFGRYNVNFPGITGSVDAGVEGHSKARTNFYNTYIFNPLLEGGNGQPFVDIYAAKWLNDGAPQNPLGSVENGNTYRATENIEAGFLSGRARRGLFDFTGGLRIEGTQETLQSYVSANSNIAGEVAVRYNEILPDLHVKYHLHDAASLRISYFKSLSRPTLQDLSFYSIQYEDYREAGNPFLHHSTAHNLDIQYDYTSDDHSWFRAGVFYKYILNPYEHVLLNANDELYPIPDGGLDYTPAQQLTGQMRNFGAATDAGVELSAAKRWGRLNVTGNYTFTHSAIAQEKKFKTRSDPFDVSSDIITVGRLQRRPMQGQASHVANLILDIAISERFSLETDATYTGRNIFFVSGWYDLDYWQRGKLQWNASAKFDGGKLLSFFAKVSNLTGAETIVELRHSNPEYASHNLPGQVAPSRIRIMQQTSATAFFAGVALRL